MTLPEDLYLVVLDAENLIETLRSGFDFKCHVTDKFEGSRVLLDYKCGEILLLDTLSSDLLKRNRVNMHAIREQRRLLQRPSRLRILAPPKRAQGEGLLVGGAVFGGVFVCGEGNFVRFFDGFGVGFDLEKGLVIEDLEGRGFDARVTDVNLSIQPKQRSLLKLSYLRVPRLNPSNHIRLLQLIADITKLKQSSVRFEMIHVMAISSELVDHGDLHLIRARAVKVHLALVQVLLVLELMLGFGLVFTFVFFLLLLDSLVVAEEVVHILDEGTTRFVLPDQHCGDEVVLRVAPHLTNLQDQPNSHQQTRRLSSMPRCGSSWLSVVLLDILDEKRDKFVQMLIEHERESIVAKHAASFGLLQRLEHIQKRRHKVCPLHTHLPEKALDEFERCFESQAHFGLHAVIGEMLVDQI